MLEVVGQDPVASLTSGEEALMIEKDQEPQEAQATTPNTPICPKKASEPEEAVSLGVMVDMQRQLPPTPPGFAELLVIESGSPPLEDVDSPVGRPMGTWLDLTSLGSMQMIITHIDMMGEMEYCYETRVISRTFLHLTPPDFPD